MDADKQSKIFVTLVVAVVLVGGLVSVFWSLLGGSSPLAQAPAASSTPETTPTPEPTPTPTPSPTPEPTPSTTPPVVAPNPAPVKTPTPVVKKPVVPKVKIIVGGVGRLSYLVGLKQSLTCSIKTTVGTKRSGTLYVAEGKVRINFTSSSMIADGTYLYAWLASATKGVQLPAAQSASGSVIAANGGIDPGNDISYSCSAWVENSSVFTPPSTVTFSTSLYS